MGSYTKIQISARECSWLPSIRSFWRRQQSCSRCCQGSSGLPRMCLSRLRRSNKGINRRNSSKLHLLLRDILTSLLISFYHDLYRILCPKFCNSGLQTHCKSTGSFIFQEFRTLFHNRHAVDDVYYSLKVKIKFIILLEVKCNFFRSWLDQRRSGSESDWNNFVIFGFNSAGRCTIKTKLIYI